MICRILLLITLTSCVCGTFVVNVTQSSYQAEENQNITLEWTFTIKKEMPLTSLYIFCELFSDPSAPTLFQLHEGVEVSECQDEHFAGRVQFDKDVLREGQIRLHVSRLRTDDSGLYVCEVKTNYGFNVGKCRLSVTAADEPERQRPTESPQPESPQPESPQPESPQPESPQPESPQPESPQSESPQPESRGRIILYVGLAASAALLTLCVGLCFVSKFCFNKSTDKKRYLSSGVQMTSFSEKTFRTHRTLSLYQNDSSESWIKTSDIKPRDRLLDSLPPTSVLRATNLPVM